MILGQFVIVLIFFIFIHLPKTWKLFFLDKPLILCILKSVKMSKSTQTGQISVYLSTPDELAEQALIAVDNYLQLSLYL